MAWQDQLNGKSLDWLLESDTPGVRYLALRDLMDCAPGNRELQRARAAAHREGPIASVLAEMNKAGYWAEPGPGYNPKYRSTIWSIILLAQLGASVEEDDRIGRACAYLAEYALAAGGQFSMSGAPSGTVDCLQGNLCWALLELGYYDPRLATAFEWMARSVTGEGIAAVSDKAAPVRYYAYKCGPNFACGANTKLPCAWGAAKVMLAFGRLPMKKRTPLVKRAIKQGVDFLFSVEPAQAGWPSGATGKPSQSWWKFGFPVFYVTDLLQVAEGLVSLGLGRDKRLLPLLSLICEKQNAHGQWLLEYDYTGKTWVDFGAKKEPNKWVTLRALRVLKAAGAAQ
jgi:hypothetical protein